MPLRFVSRLGDMLGRVAGLVADVGGRCRTLNVVIASKAFGGALRQPYALRRANTAKVCSHQDTPSSDLGFVPVSG